MSRFGWLSGALAALAAGVLARTALAEDLPPLDLASVDPEIADGFFGRWEIADETGSRRCGVVLGREPAIGGLAIEVGADCAAIFPVMGEVAAYRLYEGWTIVLADAARKELIRLTTPDEGYVASPATDGIHTIEKVED